MPRVKIIKRWSPGLASWTALVFVAIAVAAVFLYDHHKLRAWTPNIAASAASIAITVTIVNGIVRSEARRRIRPRAAGALQSVSRSVQLFTGLVALDYSSTHLDTFRSVPKTAPEMLALWAAEWDTDDWGIGEYLAMIITDGQQLAGNLEQIRARNFDVLEPALLHAIDEFGLRMMQINNWHKFVKAGPDEHERSEREVGQKVVQEVHRLSLVLQRYTPDAMMIDLFQPPINEIREQKR